MIVEDNRLYRTVGKQADSRLADRITYSSNKVDIVRKVRPGKIFFTKGYLSIIERRS